jgi:hypothetical protein
MDGSDTADRFGQLSLRREISHAPAALVAAIAFPVTLFGNRITDKTPPRGK